MNKKILVLAVILGLLTMLALNSYLGNLDRAITAETPLAEVVVAANTIPAHTKIDPDMLEVQTVPGNLVHPDALTSVESTAGNITRTDIIKGEQVLASRVASEDRPAALSYRVPEGMRAISIPVTEVSGVSGYISPGDKVDVLVSYADAEINEKTVTYTVFQNVNVLATGQSTREKEGEEREIVNTVTLAVAPTQAEVLAFANLMGSFHLTLRSPADEDKEKLDYYSPDNFNTFRER